MGRTILAGVEKVLLKGKLKLTEQVKEMSTRKKKVASKFPPLAIDFLDYYTLLGNCPTTPPLRQHFALSEK